MDVVLLAAAAVGLILFVSFVVSRLVRAKTAGLSIRMQMFLALASVVGAFALGLGLLVLDRVKGRADYVGREAALGEARSVAALLGTEMEDRGESLATVAARLGRRATSRSDSALALTLLDPDGKVVFQRGPSPETPGVVAAEVPITVHNHPVGTARVVKPTLVIEQALADVAPTVLLLSLVLGAAAAAAAAIIGRAIARPIEALTRFAERVSGGDRRAPPPLGYGREVSRLRRALDSMRRELEGRPFVETFATDLSHELKNPVAAIRASGEVLRDGALDDPAEAERFVRRILESTSRIEVLLGELLSLARLEGRGIDDAERVDLARVVQGVVDRAEAHDETVALTVNGTFAVRGDRRWLTRAVENLLDNARVHGHPPIAVAVRRDRDEVVVEVRNGGAIPEAVRPRVFRRFVTTRADRGGTGLGLSIVRAVADAHGGRVECSEPGPDHVTFALRLPVA